MYRNTCSRANIIIIIIYNYYRSTKIEINVYPPNNIYIIYILFFIHTHFLQFGSLFYYVMHFSLFGGYCSSGMKLFLLNINTNQWISQSGLGPITQKQINYTYFQFFSSTTIAILKFSNQFQLHHFNYICIMESHLLINLCSVCC